MLTDEDTALQAIAALEDLTDEQRAALDSINAIINNGEPFVDVHELFALYNVLYFRKLLVPRVEVIWSPRLTLCAGICELSKDPTTGKFTRIRLKLSTPLLQYRPRSDTINTLLHEAIHAYFFVTTSWRHSRGDDGTGHGVGFQLLADAINSHGNYEVTVYHTFHDEVDSYRTHVWQCDGPCKTRPPYFGLVKRSMNRAPGKSDTWWATHEVECGGTYTKVQEPEISKKQLEAMSAKERAGRQKNKLDGWVKSSATASSGPEASTPGRPLNLSAEVATSNPPSAKRKASKLVADDVALVEGRGSATDPKRPRTHSDDKGPKTGKEVMVQCPICNETSTESGINDHLDVVHLT